MADIDQVASSNPQANIAQSDPGFVADDPGFTPDKVASAAPQGQPPQEQQDPGFIPDTPPQGAEMGGFSANDGSMTSLGDQKKNLDIAKTYVDKNLAAYRASDEFKLRNPEQHEAKNFWEELKAAYQGSSMGLTWQQKMPDTIPSSDPDWQMKIADAIGMGFEAPAFLLGGTVGGLITGAEGAAAGSIVPGAGTIAGGIGGLTLGSSVGAFAAPMMIRKIMMDQYQRGEVKDRREAIARLLGTAWEGIKGGMTGAATAIAGGVTAPFLAQGAASAGEFLGAEKIGNAVANQITSKIGGKLTNAAGELATMVTFGQALEGKIPNIKDFENAALIIGGAHAIGMIPKLRNIFANTGQRPEEIAQRAETDVQLKQDLINPDPKVPPQAQESKPVHWSENEMSVPMADEQGRVLSEAERQAKFKANQTGKRQFITDPGSDKPREILPDNPPPPHQHWTLQLEDESKPKPGQENLTDDEKEIASKIGTEVAQKRTWRQSFNDWYDKNIDFTAPQKRAETSFENETGTKIKAEDSAHVASRLFGGFLEKMRLILNYGLPDENSAFSGDALHQVYKDVDKVPGASQAGFDLYSVSKRVVELNERGIETGFNVETAERVVEAGKDKYEALHQRREAVKSQILDYGVQKGIFSKKAVEAAKAANKDHISFQRILPYDEMKGGEPGNGRIFQKIKGSDLDLKDPRTSDYDAIVATIKRADINAIRLKMIDSLSYIGADGKIKNDFVREVKPTIRPIEISKEELAKKLGDSSSDGVSFEEYKKQIRDHLPDASIEDIRDAYNGEHGSKFKDITIFRKEVHIGDNQIAIWRDGKMSVLEGTKDVIDSLKRLQGDPTMSGMTLKLANKISNALRLGTVFDPRFGVRHTFRAGVMSGIYSQTGQIPFIHSAYYLDEFMKGASDDYKNWIYNGGSVAGLDKLNESYISNNLQQADSKYPFQDNRWNLVKRPLDATEHFIKMTDNLSRFTEYKRAMAQGKSMTEAAFLSREVTPDYAKQGMQRSFLRSSVAFIGAHINSLDRMAQAFKDDPQGTILKMSFMTAASAALWWVNKGDKDIEDLPDYQKDLYWNLRIHGTNSVLPLAKPWGPGILFGSGTERILDAFFTDNPHAFEGFSKSMYESVIPNILPTMLAPVYDQFANRNHFTGRQLVNDEQKKLLPEMQYQPYTSETAKGLAAVIGYVPGIRDIGPSDDPLASPEVVENYIRGWTGSLGMMALRITDQAIKLNQIKKAPTADQQQAEPGQFSGNQLNNDQLAAIGPDTVDSSIMDELMTRFPSMKTQPITEFYKNLDYFTRLQNSLKYAENHGDVDEYKKILRDHPDAEFKLKDINDMLKIARQCVNNIQYKDAIHDPVQKRQIIDTCEVQMNSAAKLGNQMVEDFRKRLKDKGQ